MSEEDLIREILEDRVIAEWCDEKSLLSDLMKVVKQLQAEAWDEGYEIYSPHPLEGAGNPYRTDHPLDR